MAVTICQRTAQHKCGSARVFNMKIIYLMVLWQCCVRCEAEDIPCLSKKFDQDSIVCVCDEKYCDKSDPKLPSKDEFLVVSSDKAGLRYHTVYGYKTSKDYSEENLYGSILYNRTTLFKVNRNELDQNIVGFGGAITDSVGYNLNRISKVLLDRFYDAYYGSDGLRYNMARTTIGHCDYSLKEYYYDYTPYDIQMKDWKLQDADYEYRIPHLKKAKEMALDKLLLVSSLWTVPEWMREFDDSGEKLKVAEKYYSSFCLYIQKFLEAYQNEGLDMFGVSFANEPILSLGELLSSDFDKTGTVWSLVYYIKFAKEYFIPMLAKYFKNTHFIAFDDSRNIISTAKYIYLHEKEFFKSIEFAGIHSYYDFDDSSSSLDKVHNESSRITILTTEFGAGQKKGVLLGSWDTATYYAKIILQELNHFTSGWIDWNMTLDTKGGPKFAGIKTDAAIIVDHEKNIFYKQPSYYAIGHFSKFMSRGSVKIGLKSKFPTPLKYGAVLRKDSYITAVIYNPTAHRVNVKIEDGDCLIDVTLTANSINTLIF